MREEPGARKTNYLRISVTDRCNLRCRYCTYWRDWQKLPSFDLKEPLRLGLGDDLLGYLFQEAKRLKAGKAGFPSAHYRHPGRSMVSIGG
jgi:MoaA/NifB/PqqE/SkfB family radical SAM enzyme